MLKAQIYKDKKNEWRLRIKAYNGRILCSTEGYKRKRSCYRVLELIKEDVIVEVKK